MAIMKTCEQMEDRNNHLCEHEVLLQTLVTKMESCLDEEKETCNSKLKKNKVLLFYSRGLANARVSAYEKLNKISDKEGGVLYVLKGKITI